MLAPARETWTYDWLYPNLVYRADMTPYVLSEPAPQVQHDASQAVKRSFTFSSLPGLGNDPLNDLVRPHYRLLAPDGGWLDWALGTFLFMPPKKEVNEAATILQYTALDLSQLLIDDQFTVAYTVPANTPVVGAIQAICNSLTGQTPIAVSIPPPFSTLRQSLVWDAGTTKLAAINDLLAAVTYRPAWFDELGVLRSGPIPDYNVVTANYTWDSTVGNSVVTSTPLQEIPDFSNAANWIKVIGEDPRTQPPSPIFAQYKITRPESPLCLGKYHAKVKVINDTRIADQLAANTRATAEAQAAARIYGNVTLQTLAWPVGQDFDVWHHVFYTADEGTQDWNFLELGWQMNCGVGLETQHLIQRITLT